MEMNNQETNDLYQKIGRRISQLRKAHGLTQEVLAERLNVTVKHISAVERGISSLSIEKFIEVSRILDCTIDYLFTGIDYGEPIQELPPSILSVLKSGNSKELSILMDYLRMYVKLRGQN